MPIDYNAVDRLQAKDKELLIRKNRAYGNDNIITAGLAGVGTRLLDKVSRLITFTKDPNFDPGDESVHDTLADISNYGMLGRMLLDNELNDRPSSVYLAGPIDLAEYEQRVSWRRMAAAILSGYGISSFDPNAAWTGGTLSEASKRAVMEIDLSAIEVCGMMMAYLPSNVHTIGTIREIEFAARQGKRVVVASPWAGSSAFSVDLECYHTLWQATCAIIGIDEEEYSEVVRVINESEGGGGDAGESNRSAHSGKSQSGWMPHFKD